jgi:hypothetical protein
VALQAGEREVKNPLGTIGPACERASAIDLVALTIRTRLLDDGPQAVLMRGGSVFSFGADSPVAEKAIRCNPNRLVGVYTKAAERSAIAADLRHAFAEEEAVQ